MTLKDRVGYAALGIVGGAAAGAMLAIALPFGGWVHGGLLVVPVACSVACGLIGLIWGADVGTAVGELIGTLDPKRNEPAWSSEMPRWFIVLVLVGVCVFVGWFVQAGKN